jgi:hypothetical protein
LLPERTHPPNRGIDIQLPPSKIDLQKFHLSQKKNSVFHFWALFQFSPSFLQKQKFSYAATNHHSVAFSFRQNLRESINQIKKQTMRIALI